ncbi:MAG TPA: methylmalonyl-CoA epimerase [Chloroflexota bacterium]|nr:methylmalonyl-CoA epimerase [Chloroflexota bacterium]
MAIEELFTAVDHIGIATPTLEQGLALYEHVFGLRGAPRQELPDQGTAVIMLRCGDTGIELLAPLAPDSPVGKFLAERGPGMHHVAYRVHDLQAALSYCRNAGLELIDQQPRQGAGGHLVAFLHPRSTGRVLI